MKAFLGLWFCTLLFTGTTLADPKPLIVGMEMNFPPFEMLGMNGQPTGVSVDLAQALGKSLGRPVKLENIPFEGLIPSLRTGKIDVIISSMTATPDRRVAIDFSEPYLKMGLALLVNKNSKIQSIKDVDQPNIQVAVKKGTTGHVYAQEHLTQAKILVFDQDSTCATEVSQGKADCMIYDQVSIFNHWKKCPETTRALLQPFQQEEWAIGLHRGDDELRQKVNAFLEGFKKTGGFEALGNKYLSENKKAFAKEGIPFYF